MTEADNKRKTYMSRKNYEGKILMLAVVIWVLMIPTLVLIMTKDMNEDSKFWLVISILVIPFIIVLLGPTIDKILMKKKFKKGCTKTWATIIDHDSEWHMGGTGPDFTWHATYCIVIRFFAAEKEWTVEAGVSRKFYDATVETKNIKVTYADSDPRYFMLEGEF